MAKSTRKLPAVRNHVARASVLLNRAKVVPDKRGKILRQLAKRESRRSDPRLRVA